MSELGVGLDFTSIVKKQNLFSLHVVFKLKVNHHILKSPKAPFPVDNGGCLSSWSSNGRNVGKDKAMVHRPKCRKLLLVVKGY